MQMTLKGRFLRDVCRIRERRLVYPGARAQSRGRRLEIVAGPNPGDP